MDRRAPAAAASPLIANGVLRSEDFTVTSLLAVIAECRSRLKTLHSNLERAIEVNIGDLCRYASNEERIDKIRQGIERGDLTLLTEFITQLLTVHLLPAENSFHEAVEAVKEVRSLSIESVTDCRIKAEEAKSKKEAAKLVSGVIAIGGLGVGMVISVVAGAYGYYTVSTLLGLYLTTAISAVAVYRLSSKFATWEDKLRELSQSLDKVMLSASSLLDLTRTIKEDLESVSRKVDIVNQAREKAQEAPSRLVSAFDRLCQKIVSLGASAYLEQLRAMNEDL